LEKFIKSCSSFFARENTMNISFVITVILFGINILTKLFVPLFALFIIDVVFLLCVIFLFIAFKHHNKNVQKGLLGAVLMWYLYDNINYYLNGILLDNETFIAYDNAAGITYVVLNLIIAVLFTGLFANHFIINSDRHSRPVNVFINQLLVISISVISLASIPSSFILLANRFWGLLEEVTWAAGLPALVILIASYESRLDAYKLDREDAGWTEEKGYPEDYIHEYQKK